MCLDPPAETETTSEVNPETWTGVDFETKVPSPSCPLALFPQHLTEPAVVTAHVWSPPEETETIPEIGVESVAEVFTSTEVVLLTRVPSPNRPKKIEEY